MTKRRPSPFNPRNLELRPMVGRAAPIRCDVMGLLFAVVAGATWAWAMPAHANNKVHSGPESTRDSHDDPQARVYLNFDGATLAPALRDDSRHNLSSLARGFPGLVGDFKGATGTAIQREAVVQAVLSHWEDFDVTFTEQRPMEGDYTMVLVGEPAGEVNIGTGVGIATLDCNDNMTHNNIVFGFFNFDDGSSVALRAKTISQEIAHSYGLEHVTYDTDIMRTGIVAPNSSFVDQCVTIDDLNRCAAQHEVFCPPGQQNSYADLMNLFGPTKVDKVAPVVALVAPVDGDTFVVGEQVVVAADATDDRMLDSGELHIDGMVINRRGAPYEWVVEFPEPGDYDLRALVQDAAGNQSTSNVVTVTVVSGGPDGGVIPGLPGSDRETGCRVITSVPHAGWVVFASILVWGLRRTGCGTA